MYSCTLPVPDPGASGVRALHPPRRGCECPKKTFFSRIYGNGLVEFGVFWDCLRCFNVPHDGYANRSNSQKSLPRAVGSPTDSQTVLPRPVG